MNPDGILINTAGISINTDRILSNTDGILTSAGTRHPFYQHLTPFLPAPDTLFTSTFASFFLARKMPVRNLF